VAALAIGMTKMAEGVKSLSEGKYCSMNNIWFYLFLSVPTFSKIFW